MADHYLTSYDMYESVHKWELEPSNIEITRWTDDQVISLPKIAAYWVHTETGDVAVVCDGGVSGYYELYHIPEKHVEDDTSLLKRLRYSNPKQAEYSHGERVLQSERTNPETFISEVHQYLEAH